ncbi:HsdM family class I SAM-dependent methyltransferase [Lacticaseibacillus paracasei]|uniref:HsdM family class I SAM-dependent methyltransferase n=1 Tax=Lacticaseibacillus paracasei TaxID=1597 RepID=UPI0003438401|nr:N-6 DNA methylase [Lacticaseibacillus paracasei]EPC20942.1 Methyltransferase domain protein [Lacticaseibacillus paracasei subsp. paracasei Lpp230]MCT3362334.1 SAM-dependent DNA methyltransferase [Lacticaseibacillus paracasei]MDC6273596.1 N-6 DNA methylase [Lacticaseibacillus paracasei]MDN4553731.1 N-6 DNA methylase [Lacticaseibacillus paracasei]UNG79626.1 N-6 DNA methylase [Lacticaseibacillus paracasei]
MENFKHFMMVELNKFQRLTGMVLRPQSYSFIGVELSTIKTFEVSDKTKLDALWCLIQKISVYFTKTEKAQLGIIYTPRNVAEYMVSLIDPERINGNTKVVDPAVGSGALLIAYLQRLQKLNPKINLNKYVSKCIYGFDIQKENALAAECVLNIYVEIHGFRPTGVNISEQDSLKLPFDQAYLKSTFDIVLGNPPYVRAKKIPNEYRNFLREAWGGVISGQPDIYIPFFSLAYWLARPEGQIVYISPNSFFGSNNGKKLRKFIQENLKSVEIYSFHGDRIFGDDVMTYSAITRLTMGKSQKASAISFISRSGEPQEILINPENGAWRLLLKKDQNIIEKLEHKYSALTNFVLRNGIATQRNSIYSFTPVESDENYYYTAEGDVIESAVTRALVLPNRQHFTRLRIIFPYEWSSEAKRNVLISENQFKRNYPHAYKYLLNNKASLDRRKSDSGVWYAYGRSQGISLTGTRLYIPYMAYKVQSFISTDPTELFAAGYALFSDDIDFLKGVQRILSTDIFTYYLIKVSKPYSSGYYSTSKSMIQHFSIPDIKEINWKKYLKSSDLEKSTARLYGISHEQLTYIHHVVTKMANKNGFESYES